jgi:hypothetical protein
MAIYRICILSAGLLAIIMARAEVKMIHPVIEMMISSGIRLIMAAPELYNIGHKGGVICDGKSAINGNFKLSSEFQKFYVCSDDPVEAKRLDDAHDDAKLIAFYKKDRGRNDNNKAQLTVTNFLWGSVKSICTPTIGSTCYYFLQIKMTKDTIALRANAFFNFDFKQIQVKKD